MQAFAGLSLEICGGPALTCHLKVNIICRSSVCPKWNGRGGTDVLFCERTASLGRIACASEFPKPRWASFVAIAGEHVLRGNAVIRNRATSFTVEAEDDRLGSGEAERAIHNMRCSAYRR
jgi:hypothetical protein